MKRFWMIAPENLRGALFKHEAGISLKTLIELARARYQRTCIPGNPRCSEAFLSCDGKGVSMKFKVILEGAEEGGYIASCPALPGCHSEGDTVEEALDNIREAIAGCIESLNEEKGKAFGSHVMVVEVTV
jgi:predicted RNase H-like HicB family nuclease